MDTSIAPFKRLIALFCVMLVALVVIGHTTGHSARAASVGLSYSVAALAAQTDEDGTSTPLPGLPDEHQCFVCELPAGLPSDDMGLLIKQREIALDPFSTSASAPKAMPSGLERPPKAIANV